MPRFNQYGTWPMSGEIDIMESRGNRKLFNPNGVNIGSEQVSSTLHFGPQWDMNGYEKAHYESNSAVDQVSGHVCDNILKVENWVFIFTLF